MATTSCACQENHVFVVWKTWSSASIWVRQCKIMHILNMVYYTLYLMLSWQLLLPLVLCNNVLRFTIVI